LACGFLGQTDDERASIKRGAAKIEAALNAAQKGKSHGY